MIYRFEVEIPDDLSDEIDAIVESLSDWMDGAFEEWMMGMPERLTELT